MKDEVCPRCAEEERERERRAKRDLKLEEQRRKRQASYALEMQRIKDEVEHQRRIIKFQEEEEVQKKTLEQERAGLSALQQTAARIKQQKEDAQRREAQASQVKIGSQKSGDAVTPQEWTDQNTKHSDAEEEWERLKRDELANSKAMDDLMGMIGLESVKQEFLTVKAAVDTAVRQGVSLGKERYSCSLLGNPGTGE
jgi:hypothetical protein